MKTIRELLPELPLFSGLAETDLDLIAGCGRNVHFPPGRTIFREGDPADDFFVLRKGRVALETRTPARSIIVATLGPGEVVGGSWLIPPYRWEFDARTLDETSAIALDGACLRGKCDDDTDLGYRLMKRFAQLVFERLTQARVQLLDVYGDPEPA